jgi:hypothetical protein
VLRIAYTKINGFYIESILGITCVTTPDMANPKYAGGINWNPKLQNYKLIKKKKKQINV